MKSTFSSCSQSTIFMNKAISIENGKIETVLYAKPLAFYLYIPPQSCHSSDVLTGVISGMILLIYQLCSKEKDIDQELFLVTRRILDRRQSLDNTTTLFPKEIHNTNKYLQWSPIHRKELLHKKMQEAKIQVYFYIPFHPNHPSLDIKGACKRLIYQPHEKLQLQYTTNQEEHAIPIGRFVLCYHRSPNLGNKLFYQKIDQRSGPKVTSFLDQTLISPLPFQVKHSQ